MQKKLRQCCRKRNRNCSESCDLRRNFVAENVERLCRSDECSAYSCVE